MWHCPVMGVIHCNSSDNSGSEMAPLRGQKTPGLTVGWEQRDPRSLRLKDLGKVVSHPRTRHLCLSPPFSGARGILQEYKAGYLLQRAFPDPISPFFLFFFLAHLPRPFFSIAQWFSNFLHQEPFYIPKNWGPQSAFVSVGCVCRYLPY